MTQFRILPVRRGDAYLLKSRRGSYLVDGGAMGNGLPELLTERQVRKLRAAACSSPTPDYLGGIIELMESGHPVKEYWLPASLDTLAQQADSFDGNWSDWFSLFEASANIPGRHSTSRTDSLEVQPRPSTYRFAGLIALALSACLASSVHQPFSLTNFARRGLDDPFSDTERFLETTISLLVGRACRRSNGHTNRPSSFLKTSGLRFFTGSTLEDLALLCGRLLITETESLPNNRSVGREVIQNLALTAMTEALISLYGPAIRYFANTGKLVETAVPNHPVRCLNGLEVTPNTHPSDESTAQRIFTTALQMTKGEKDLSFQFGDGRCSVLFCGNTRMNFLNRHRTLGLGCPTIIASPKQGHCSADKAYGHIRSEEPEKDIWVRCHSTFQRKVSPYYKAKPNKLCLMNCVHRTLNEVLLRFDNGEWNVEAGERCYCW